MHMHVFCMTAQIPLNPRDTLRDGPQRFEALSFVLIAALIRDRASREFLPVRTRSAHQLFIALLKFRIAISHGCLNSTQHLGSQKAVLKPEFAQIPFDQPPAIAVAGA